jgi:hypothetical protein
VTSGPEVLRDQSIRGKEPLGLPWRLEPLHPPLALTGGLMRVLRPVVQIAVLPMFGAWEDLPLRRAIAPQFIGHNDSWDILTPFQELAKESLRGLLIASALYQNVQDSPVLIDGPPEIVAPALDREKHLIQMPFVAWLRASTPELMGIGLSKLPAPLPDGFIRDDDATGKQLFFHIAVAHAETEVQPNPMANDLGRETVVLVLGSRSCVHETSIAHQMGAGQAVR